MTQKELLVKPVPGRCGSGPRPGGYLQAAAQPIRFMSDTMPIATAPDAPGSDSLEALIEQAASIATHNASTIEKIKATKSFRVFSYGVSTKVGETSMKFDVVEEIENLNFDEIREKWRVSPEHRLEIITPDLFRDAVNYDCNTVDDIVMVNERMLEACRKYWFLDQAKATPVILKFIKNFNLVKAALEDLESKYLEPKSKMQEVQERLNGINSAIEDLVTIAPVSFQKAKIVVNGGIILDNALRETLGKMFGRKVCFSFLASSATIGVAPAAFDSTVRGKGPFLVIIRASTGHIFGAYVPEEFSTKVGHQACHKDLFLFALGNQTGRPLKLIPTPTATMHFGNCGLHIGAFTCFCSHQCGDLSGQFSATPGYSAELAAGCLLGTPGQPNFSPNLMEIFSLAPQPG